MKPKALTSAQIRAARALLDWSAKDLAQVSSLGLATIRRAENSRNVTSITAANNFSVRRALEAAGVEFIDENGGGAGVRLRQPSQPKAPKK
jgi:transcriptional regulator with XRE-family HTH domain